MRGNTTESVHFNKLKARRSSQLAARSRASTVNRNAGEHWSTENCNFMNSAVPGALH